MKNETVKYIIRELPPSNNRYIGRNQQWEYQAEKKRWRALVLEAVGRNKPPVPYRRAKVTLRYYFPTRTRRDPDNYSGKMLLDGLVHAGVLADDSFNVVELRLHGDYDKASPRTEIEVEGQTPLEGYGKAQDAPETRCDAR